jgi:nitrate reductase gamma subunit
MSAIEFLNWVRGPALQVSLMVFIIGMLIRVFEFWLLGRKKDLSVARDTGSMAAGLRTILTRSVPPPGMWSHLIAGYIFHVGFILVLFFFVPHILLFKKALGLSWPGLPNGIIDGLTIISLSAMVYTLAIRISDPVRRMLSNFNDYFAWLVTFLPLLTGYLAFHRHVGDYTLMLGIHILSVNLLLIAFPFTKLTHAITVFAARWYNGAVAGRKGVRV